MAKNINGLIDLVWTETQWIDYVSNEKVETYIFKYKDDLVGFFELIFHSEKKEVEIAYFGIIRRIFKIKN